MADQALHMKSIPQDCIFIVCHKPCFIPDNPLFYPVQVGAELADCTLKGMQPDNTGDNISSKNPDYCELTAQYWAWKNADCAYYGFFHYRRFMAFDRVAEADKDGGTDISLKPYIELDNVWEDLSKYKLNADDMHSVISRYDIITVYRERINTTVYQQYARYHNAAALDRAVAVLRDRFPEYSESADRYLGSHNIYYMNMFIMSKAKFNEYMSWLFDILSVLEEDQEFRKYHEPRIMGFISERLFGIYYTYQAAHGARCAELSYIRFYNTDPDARQVETEIRTFSAGPVRIKVDMRRLNRFFPAGSLRRRLLRAIILR